MSLRISENLRAQNLKHLYQIHVMKGHRDLFLPHIYTPNLIDECTGH